MTPTAHGQDDPDTASAADHAELLKRTAFKRCPHDCPCDAPKQRAQLLEIPLWSRLPNRRLLQDIRSLDPTRRLRIGVVPTAAQLTGIPPEVLARSLGFAGVLWRLCQAGGPDLLLDAIRVALGAGPSHRASAWTTEGMNPVYPISSPLNQGLSVCIFPSSGSVPVSQPFMSSYKDHRLRLY